MRLHLIPILLFLPAGLCHQPVEIEPSDEALFCDVEEPRRFTQEEIDWRAINAQWNLVKDYQTNLTFERECPTEEIEDGPET